MGNKGIIYILTNQVMPGIIKIGMTENDDVRERAKQLYNGSTGVPVPFEIYYAAHVPNVAKVEKSLHDGFADHRVNPKREFFKMNPERVISTLQMVGPEVIDLNKITEPITEEDKENEEIIKRSHTTHRDMFRYSMIGLKEGDELSFIRDENIKAKVVENNPSTNHYGNWVEYEGQIYSLTGLAKKLLGSNTPLSGTQYWLHNGKTLDEMRSEKENQEEYDE